jgi:hypothetical protein
MSNTATTFEVVGPPNGDGNGFPRLAPTHMEF